MENKEVKTKQVKLTKDERFAEMCAKEVVKNILSTIRSMEKGVWTGKKSMAVAPTTVNNIVEEVTKGLEAIDVAFIKTLKEAFTEGEKGAECLKTQKFPKEELSKKEEAEVKEAFVEVTDVKPVKKVAKTAKKPAAKEEKKAKAKAPEAAPKAKKEVKKPVEKTEKPKKETKPKKAKK